MKSNNNTITKIEEPNAADSDFKLATSGLPVDIIGNSATEHIHLMPNVTIESIDVSQNSPNNNNNNNISQLMINQTKQSSLSKSPHKSTSGSSGSGGSNISNHHLGVHQASSRIRRRSSVAVIPPMQICPGDLLVYSKVLSQRSNMIGKPYFSFKNLISETKHL